jgi:hypothetical protein
MNGFAFQHTPGIEGNEIRGGGEVMSASGAMHRRGSEEVAPAMRSSDSFEGGKKWQRENS